MTVLMINTHDAEGGAARGTYRLHQGLLAKGINSVLFVGKKMSDDPTVVTPAGTAKSLWLRVSPRVEGLPLAFYSKRSGELSSHWLPSAVGSELQSVEADIVHVNSIVGLLPVSAFSSFHAPIVWTLHDMWPLTGICHYDQGCGRFEAECGFCPLLGSGKKRDLSWYGLRAKRAALANTPVTVVATSSWLADCARRSSLFQGHRIETIHNGLNTEEFRPIPKEAARNILALPEDKFLLLFGADYSSRRKGSGYVTAVSRRLAETGWGNQAEIVAFGPKIPDLCQPDGLRVRQLGYLHDPVSLALLYSAADLMLVPSLQEAFGQTASEALSCGTPVVAFRVGGLVDIIDHEKNGYLATPESIDDLAAGIRWVLENPTRLAYLSRNARQTAIAKFTVEKQAGRYVALYEQLCKDRQKRRRAVGV